MKLAGVIVCIITLGGCAPKSETSESSHVPADRLLLLEELGPPLLTTLTLPDQQTQLAFAVPSGGFAYEFDVHDISGDILLAYTAPPSGGGVGYDRSRIVRIDAGEVSKVACTDAPGVWCFYPLWGESDRAWFIQDGDGVELAPQPTLSRVNLNTGEVTVAVIGATEPAISSNGRKVAWISVDPFDGQRRLAVGNAEAELSRTLVDTGTHDDLGQPFFSSDGSTIYYVGISTKSVSWTGRLAEWLIPSAHAHQNHNTPADWWQVSVDGGIPAQLTHLNTIHYDGRADLSGQALVVATREGVQRIDATTGEAELVFKTRTVRALDWLP